MIMNDMSARTLQMEEMLLNLGPAKGKDFSTVIGPMLVTPDELEPFKVPARPVRSVHTYPQLRPPAVRPAHAYRRRSGRYRRDP